jgi:dipeptidase E
MKLYLSSYRLGDQPDRLVELVGSGRRAAIIFNACDQFEDRLHHYTREERDLAELGFSAFELDLRSYFNRPRALEQRLADVDLLWVVGGNTFVLARAMSASGFVSATAPLIDSSRLIYAGYSAGVCVTGPDLDGIHLMDEQEVIPEGYDASIPAETLGWVPWRIVPHWRSDHPEAPAAETAASYMEQRGLTHRTLRDGQVIIVDHG